MADMSTGTQTPAERAAEQRARRAATTNPSPRQAPINAPQASVQAHHLAQAITDWYQAEALRQQFEALSPQAQTEVLRSAQDLANAEAAQVDHTTRVARKVFTTAAAALLVATVGRDLYKATKTPVDDEIIGFTQNGQPRYRSGRVGW
jgi:hypothetical protein